MQIEDPIERCRILFGKAQDTACGRGMQQFSRLRGDRQQNSLTKVRIAPLVRQSGISRLSWTTLKGAERRPSFQLQMLQLIILKTHTSAARKV
jgi:hypothetical protein